MILRMCVCVCVSSLVISVVIGRFAYGKEGPWRGGVPGIGWWWPIILAACPDFHHSAQQKNVRWNLLAVQEPEQEQEVGGAKPALTASPLGDPVAGGRGRRWRRLASWLPTLKHAGYIFV